MMGCDVSVQKRRLPVWVRPFEEYDVEWLYRHETAPAIIETGRLRGQRRLHAAEMQQQWTEDPPQFLIAGMGTGFARLLRWSGRPVR